jgi:hypothetical protein
VNAAFRHYYHVGLCDVDLCEACDLYEEFLPIQKLMAGMDPDHLDPQEVFAQMNSTVCPPEIKEALKAKKHG